MGGFVRWIQRVIRELRRRRVLRVAGVYAGTAFVILQLGEILVEPFGLPGWTLRMVTFLLVLGFPLAVGLAWVYNITEEGLVRDVGEEPPGEEVPGEIGPEGKPLTSNGVLVGLLVLIAGLLLYPRVFSSGETGGEKTSPADTAQVEERSIAVLPFEPLSSGEKSKTFARGIHDDLLTRLANISALKVISRTAVQQYRNTDLTTEEIADSLNVRWIMEGGVQVFQDQIQVNAQLIDPRTETHAWADDYRRDLTAQNLFAIQGEITRDIAEALKTKLTAGEQKRIAGAPTKSLQAYRLYVKGRSHLNTRSAKGMRRAVDYFQQALQADSTFALAWAGLADAVGLYAEYGPDSLGASVPSHRKAAQRALTLDSTLAETQASMGFFYYNQQNAPAALRYLKRAVELKPSYAQAHHWLANTQFVVGRPKRALRHARRAVELDPHHFAATTTLVGARLANGQAKAALAQARRLRRTSPRPIAVGTEILVLHHLGRLEKARKIGRRTLSRTDRSSEPSILRFSLAMAAVAAGDTSRAKGVVSDTPYQGLLRAALGQTDAAFVAFRNVKVGEWSVPAVSTLRFLYPDLLGPLRADPRFETVIQEVNRAWGLNPDGTMPEESESATPTGSASDA